MLPLRTDSSHPQNPPKWRRVQCAGHVLLDDETTTATGPTAATIIRVHCRPRRFPSFRDVQIVSSRKDDGFIVVNKPGGCPSHATVDNAVENALAAISSLVEESRAGGAYILPQRLDAETS